MEESSSSKWGDSISGPEGSCRKEKRKEMKKTKRKLKRKEIAEKERLEEEARLNDPEEKRKMLLMEQQEAERIQRDRIAFEERERAWILLRQQQEQQLQQQSQDYEDNKDDDNNNKNDDQHVQEEEEDDDGPPEIIWKGNEIIVKKKKKKKEVKPSLLYLEHGHDGDIVDNNTNRPTSNPFPPESPSSAMPHQNVSQQIPNFGTEQDKSHCPFHLKTGACRFGQRCSRVHFYPENSCTLLIKNMYSGPGLAWDQDEGLEYTDEEVECCFDEFYGDVHTEFLKFGEIVNFKVCKNGSFHLRGNVYVQYKFLDSALLAYNSVNGRYFAGKQVTCNFVNITRWKVAICGEYMKSGYKTCSHGTACNFIHCFRNPGGDYEWADSDKPPPKYWVRNMSALFGYSDDYETLRESGHSSMLKNSSNVPKTDSDRYKSKRSRSREMDRLNSGHSDSRKQEDEIKRRTPDEERLTHSKDKLKRKYRDRTPDREWSEEEDDREKPHEQTRKSSFNSYKDDDSRSHEEYSDVDRDNIVKPGGREGRNSRKWNRDSRDLTYEAGSDGDKHRNRHHHSQRKRSRHKSRDESNVTDESESDKDRGEMEMRHDHSRRKRSRHKSRDKSNVTDESESDKDRGEMERRHDHSRRSSRHRRSDVHGHREDYDNENYKGDDSWYEGESDRREHHHKKKRLKHEKKLNSTNWDTSHESSGKLSSNNSRGDRHHHKSKGGDNHL